ncbi:MAG: hypothetical protein JW993_19690 [Sedimentisphaerales bacterium]|nr:hypothetical protein [Sedimentisphaerales bacterium]
MRNCAFVLVLLLEARVAFAQISVEGVADQEVYRDRVSFTVHSEAGYEYTASLNGESIATDVPIEVTEPQYYELFVEHRLPPSGVEDRMLIRFIVRASERADTEWGLPVWTPYPAIPSASSEFDGARLEVIAPAGYPLGLDIPIIARVQDESGRRVGVNGTVTADHPLELLRGVGFVFLPAATDAGTLSFEAKLHSLGVSEQIAIEAATAWQTVSEDIVASVDWGENARVRVTNDLTIASDVTLTIGAGDVIVLDPGVTIAVEGHIVVNGTSARPVVFTAQDRSAPWGGFLFESSACSGEFTGAIFTASGADSDWFDNNPGHGHSHRDEQCLFYVSDGAHVALTDCFVVENRGQLGHGENGYLTLTGCLVQKAVTCGQYNGGAVVATDSAFIEFPSARASFADADNDAFYLSGGAHAFTDCLVGWTLDDGIDAGEGAAGSVSVERCWFESTYHEAMAWSSGPRHAIVTDTVVLNCGQAIECGYGAPDVNAVGCLLSANLVGARFGDNYDRSYNGFLKVTRSLLLCNWRDVWGRAWDDWTVHLTQMDIRDNYLSAPNVNHPDNLLWAPDDEPNQVDLLATFLPPAAGTVGIGLAVPKAVFDMAEFQWRFPVRLSTFTADVVSVDYVVKEADSVLDSGALRFLPGETLKMIPFVWVYGWLPREPGVTLGNPVNAELTGHSTVTYRWTLDEPLIVAGDEWRYFKGTAEPPVGWNTLAFDDSGWLAGPTGVGYETGSGYESHLATNLTDMRGNYLSVYTRRLFHVEDPSRFTGLTLAMDFDDGYIAYLNGVRVDARFAPNPPAHDQPAATDNHEACCGDCQADRVSLSDRLHLLVPGWNVLAVQVHNQSLSSSDFLFIPELSGVVEP